MNIKLIYLSLLFLGSLFVSCEKEENEPETPVVEQPATKTPEELLTASIWRLEEIRFLQQNTPYYYKRGQTSDPYGFNDETIKFNVNKSGTYIAGGINYSFTWEFIDAAKTKIRYIVNYPTPVTVNWENVSLTESNLKYGEYYNRSGTNTFSIATRIH